MQWVKIDHWWRFGKSENDSFSNAKSSCDQRKQQFEMCLSYYHFQNAAQARTFGN